MASHVDDTWQAMCHNAWQRHACVTHGMPCVNMHGTFGHYIRAFIHGVLRSVRGSSKEKRKGGKEKERKGEEKGRKGKEKGKKKGEEERKKKEEEEGVLRSEQTRTAKNLELRYKR